MNTRTISNEPTQPTYGDGRPWNPPSPHSLQNRLGRALWGVVWSLLFRPSPWFLRGWRRFLLRSFGANIGSNAVIHPSVRIWAPWNLQMGQSACLSWNVDCYTVGKVVIGDYAIISQYTYLCSATHEYNHVKRPVVAAPITIGARAWVCAEVFIGPGVTIGENSVIGARAVVVKDMPANMICAGHPCKPIKERSPVSR